MTLRPHGRRCGRRQRRERLRTREDRVFDSLFTGFPAWDQRCPSLVIYFGSREIFAGSPPRGAS